MKDSFGQYLRRERELREISLEEISARTKIKKSFLEALEKDQLSELPGEAFIRGFIRAYAQEVGLDPAQTLLRFEEFLKARSEPKQEAVPTFSFPKWLVSIAGVIILLALALAFFSRPTEQFNSQEPEAITSSQETQPTLSETGSAQSSEAEISPFTPPYKISIRANELCWILATMDEATSREATLYPGETLELTAEKKISLLVGNAGGVEVYVNRRKLKPLGEHWQAVRILIPQELEKYLEKSSQKEKRD